MTLPTDPYPDPSSGPGGAANPARAVTGSMRQIAATALLVGNGVFLFLGISDLLLVVGGWASGFGGRSEAVFSSFAGPVAIALPLLAMLLATHVSPVLPTSRRILLAALGEYAVSGLFGAITYLGAFANGLFLVRGTFDGLLSRAVWLAFLTIAAAAVHRVHRAMYPPAPARTYGPTVYGRPYPGQPTYPPPSYRPGAAESWQGPTVHQPAPQPRPATPPAQSSPPAEPAESTRRVPLDPGPPLG